MLCLGLQSWPNGIYGHKHFPHKTKLPKYFIALFQYTDYNFCFSQVIFRQQIVGKKKLASFKMADLKKRHLFKKKTTKGKNLQI